jgi:TolA-binding protein
MNDCVTWASLSDKVAIGEAISPEDRLFLRSHLGGCSACAAEAELWETLGKVLEEPERLASWPSEANAQPTRRGWLGRWSERGDFPKRSRPLLAGAVLLAAAAGAIVWALPNQQPPAAPAQPMTRASGEPRPATAPARAGGARLALAAGEILVDRRAAVAGEWLARGALLTVEEGQACVLVPPGVTACLEAGTKLTIETLEPTRRRFRLHEGHVVAHLDRQPLGSTFGFETAAGSVVAKGTVFSLKTDGVAVTLRVHEGVVLNDQGKQAMPYEAPSAALLSPGSAPSRASDVAEMDSRLVDLAKYFNDRAQSSLVVTAATGSSVTLSDFQLGVAPVSALVLPGQYRMEVARAGFASIVEQLKVEPGVLVSRSYEATPELGEASGRRSAKTARPNMSTAAQLLERARELRADGRYREAHGAYQQLLREHAATAEARVALVSLGELQLSQLGDAKGALRSFDAYLRGGGALRQEASYGRVRALQRLGRASEARAAADAFVSAYPKSVQAATLRKELP